MLHDRQENYVSFANKFSTPRLGHQINALGGPAREDDFVRVGSAEVISHALPRFFVGFRRARAQRVQSAMDIRVVVLVKIPERLDHHARLLRSCSAIEIDQRMPMRPFAQDLEILANSGPINGLGGKLVHTTICYQAPLRTTSLPGVKVERVVLNALTMVVRLLPLISAPLAISMASRWEQSIHLAVVGQVVQFFVH